MQGCSSGAGKVRHRHSLCQGISGKRRNYKDFTDEDIEADRCPNDTIEETWYEVRGDQLITAPTLQVRQWCWDCTTLDRDFRALQRRFRDSGEIDEEEYNCLNLDVEQNEIREDTVRKAIRGAFGCEYYSYFSKTERDSNAHKCINPLHIGFSRPPADWNKQVILMLCQSGIAMTPTLDSIFDQMGKSDNWSYILR